MYIMAILNYYLPTSWAWLEMEIESKGLYSLHAICYCNLIAKTFPLNLMNFKVIWNQYRSINCHLKFRVCLIRYWKASSLKKTIFKKHSAAFRIIWACCWLLCCWLQEVLSSAIWQLLANLPSQSYGFVCMGMFNT